jgi:predicted phosphodiesterase
MIRYRRGNKGADCREKAKKNHGKTFRTNGAAGWSIPKSDKKINKPYKLVPGKWLILSDIHVPYHDEEALEIALKHGEDQGIEHIYLNGDTCDFYNVSRFPKAKIVFKIGNHEDRWEKYLYLKAPELIGVANFELYYVLDFAKYGIELVKSTQKAKAGKHLTILHGHEVRNTGVYPARTLMLRTHVCSIAGHNHRTSTYTEKTSDNKFLVSFTSGCLSELEPDYMPINQWNLGFIILDFDGNDFTVNNLRILNGQVK